jgi:hypothetical protein
VENWDLAEAAAGALNGVTVGADNLIVRVAEASAKKEGMRAAPGVPPTAQPNRFQPYGRTPQMVPQMSVVSPMPQYQMTPQVVQYIPQQQYIPAVYPPAVQVLPQIQRPTTVTVNVPPENCYCIFIYGVRGMDESFLMKLFGQFGAIASAQAPPGKNFGFVKMPNYAEAQNAVNTLNGCMLQGATSPLQVSFKDNKPQ